MLSAYYKKQIPIWMNCMFCSNLLELSFRGLMFSICFVLFLEKCNTHSGPKLWAKHVTWDSGRALRRVTALNQSKAKAGHDSVLVAVVPKASSTDRLMIYYSESARFSWGNWEWSKQMVKSADSKAEVGGQLWRSHVKHWHSGRHICALLGL